ANAMVALKGQNKGAPQPVVLPFQGDQRIAAFSNPGRCPGLICFRPFGQRREGLFFGKTGVFGDWNVIKKGQIPRPHN
ncbi:MAG TPA: hypothetical protein VH744_07985, partial [Terriglobales bacterium]